MQPLTALFRGIPRIRLGRGAGCVVSSALTLEVAAHGFVKDSDAIGGRNGVLLEPLREALRRLIVNLDSASRFDLPANFRDGDVFRRRDLGRAVRRDRCLAGYFKVSSAY